MLHIVPLTTAAGLALAGAAAAQNYPWNPEKPITLIVPWAAGGSTDQVRGVAAGEIEKALGQKVVVVNQPGASGSIGTRNALGARRTATPGPRAPPRTSAPTRSAACSTPRSPIGGSISPSPTSRCSASTTTRLQERRGRRERHEGEARPGLGRDRRRQLLGPHGDRSVHPGARPHLQARDLRRRQPGGDRDGRGRDRGDDPARGRAGRDDPRQALRPLAVLSDKPLELEGFGTIPPITASVPGFKPTPTISASSCRRTCRRPCSQTLDMIWKDVIVKSEALKNYAANAAPCSRRPTARRQQACDAGHPGRRVAAAGRRQGQGVARHGRHPDG